MQLPTGSHKGFGLESHSWSNCSISETHKVAAIKDKCRTALQKKDAMDAVKMDNDIDEPLPCSSDSRTVQIPIKGCWDVARNAVKAREKLRTFYDTQVCRNSSRTSTSPVRKWSRKKIVRRTSDIADGGE